MAVERSILAERTSATIPSATWRADLLTCVLSGWLVTGAFLDGWAHNTRANLETFFTPWHAVLYSGFAVSAGWIGWMLMPGVRAGVGLRRAMPAGYGWAVVGLLLFCLSGVGDLLWHELFGVEQDVASLLSPTHLGLVCGALLMVTAPWRSARANRALGDGRAGFGRLFPAVLSLALAGSGVAFILQEWHPVKVNQISAGMHQDLVLRYGPRFWEVSDFQIRAGVASFILASVFLFGPLLLLLRSWPLPGGAVVLAIGVQCVLVQGLTGFDDPGLAVLGVVGAAAVEGLARLIRPDPQDHRRLRLFFLLAPPLFWGVYVVGILSADHHLGWKAEVWGGSLVWTGLVMLGLAVLSTLPPQALPRDEMRAWSAGAGPEEQADERPELSTSGGR
jgi:hypothetical protein